MKDIAVSKLKANKSNPRTITKDKVEKLKNSIESFKKMMELRPIIVDEDYNVLGGNMRLQALKELNYRKIPENWIRIAEGLTEDEKREFIVKDNVGFGSWDYEILANEWDEDLLTEWGLDVDFISGGSGTGSGSEGSAEKYSREILAPIYEPSGDKPELSELYNTEKTDELIKDIKESKLPKAEKDFLIEAAKRHTVFNYENIANYYAQSDPEVQDLMERSALVIIDFKKAIENGFVRLSDEVIAQYMEDHPDDEK